MRVPAGRESGRTCFLGAAAGFSWCSALTGALECSTHPAAVPGVPSFPQGGLPMRFKAALLSLALTAVAAGAVNAGPVWFGVMGGAAVPTGDFSDAASTGFDFGGTATWMVNDMWGVGADVAYHMWNGSDDYNEAL